jgi:phytoene desaturase
MTENLTFDAIVVGAGAGGLFSAARLTHLGYRTLVVERLDKLGGRASTDEIDGFKVNNGAIVIETGGITEETFAEVGAEFEVRAPQPPILYRMGKKNVDVTGGGWGFMLSKLTRQGAIMAKGIGAARHDEGLPEDEISTADWVRKFTKNKAVQGIFRSMCGSVFSVSSEDLPAKVFLTYFTRKSAFKKFGFVPEGTIGIWKSLAKVIEANGGEIWLNAELRSFAVSDGEVTGATVVRDGEKIEVSTRFAISDIGPAATVGLVGDGALSADYLERVAAADRPCSMIVVNFASRERLIDAPGMISFTKTKRLVYVANFTETCPEMAPEGWNLYAGSGVPEPAVGLFDEKAELELTMQDLRDEIPGFERARILSVNMMRDGWPPQRAVSGFDLAPSTPIRNLWNVGDGVKEYANGGTTACAETAKIIVDEATALFPLAKV